MPAKTPLTGDKIDAPAANARQVHLSDLVNDDHPTGAIALYAHLHYGRFNYGFPAKNHFLGCALKPSINAFQCSDNLSLMGNTSGLPAYCSKNENKTPTDE